MAATCDIVIPSHNNARTLPLVLSALDEQAVPDGWKVRVLICDDGSTDGSTANMQNSSASWRIKFQTLYLPGSHLGAAASRNRGIGASSADIIFFLGADIILRPQALAEHLNFHSQHPAATDAALGMVVWDPRLPPTPLMEWMIHGGPQNNFDELLGARLAHPARFFYASHLSVKRSVLARAQFDEKYRGYGYEDVDLGRRLGKQGLRLFVLRQTVGLHRHLYTADAFFARQRAAGKSSLLWRGQQAHLLPRHYIQSVLYAAGIGVILRLVVRLAATRLSLPRLYAHVANYEYRRGIFHNKHPIYPQVYPQ